MPAKTPVVSKTPSACAITYPIPCEAPRYSPTTHRDDRQPDAHVQAGKDPGERAGDEDVANQLALRGAEHSGIVDDDALDFADAPIRVEEHDEKDDGDAERDLGPDPEAEPQQEDGCQHHARQGIADPDVGIEQGREKGRSREHEPGDHTGYCADRER